MLMLDFEWGIDIYDWLFIVFEVVGFIVFIMVVFFVWNNVF